jgi:lysophospholipase L1-like esterase
MKKERLIRIALLISMLLNIACATDYVMSLHPEPIAFVGDSITERLPLQSNKRYDIRNFGVSGTQTFETISTAGKAARGGPSRMFIEIGINDLYFKVSTDSAYRNFTKIIFAIRRENADMPIYVNSVFPTTGDYSYLNAAINEYNSLIKSYCKQNNIGYINMHDVFLDGNQMDQRYTDDGMHLSDQGYSLWIDSLESHF